VRLGRQKAWKRARCGNDPVVAADFRVEVLLELAALERERGARRSRKNLLADR
jgi:hypothetical protein